MEFVQCDMSDLSILKTSIKISDFGFLLTLLMSEQLVEIQN